MHSQITTLFLDIGGVLLTNGWDHNSRRRAAETFGLDYDEMNERHHLTFDTYEEGKLSLDDYLGRVVFYRERSFSREEFKTFMYAQSKPYPDMIKLIRAHNPQTRIVILTAYGSAEVEDEARRCGADAFLRKPKPLSQVAQVVQGLIESPPRQAARPA